VTMQGALGLHFLSDHSNHEVYLRFCSNHQSTERYVSTQTISHLKRPTRLSGVIWQARGQPQGLTTSSLVHLARTLKLASCQGIQQPHRSNHRTKIIDFKQLRPSRVSGALRTRGHIPRLKTGLEDVSSSTCTQHGTHCTVIHDTERAYRLELLTCSCSSLRVCDGNLWSAFPMDVEQSHSFANRISGPCDLQLPLRWRLDHKFCTSMERIA
jgi:hypothetical protein